MGGWNYELSHDTLVIPVMQSRKEREGKEEKRKVLRRNKRLAVLAVLALIISIGAIAFSLWAFKQKAEAEKQRIATQEALDKFQKAKQERDALEIKNLIGNLEAFYRGNFKEQAQALSIIDKILAIDSSQSTKISITEVQKRFKK